MGKKINLLNQTFEYLTVIEETSQRDKRGGVMWKCKCKCGNETLASTSDLRTGHKRSCGCLQKETAKKQGEKNLIDLTGKKFGLLTVLEKDYSHKSPNGSTKIYWKCKCDCGNIVSIIGQALKDGNTQSCGCIKSFGEQKISQILRDAHLSFEKEKTFNDGVTSRQGIMRFDFFVNNQYIIEYDGKQHFNDISWGHETLEQIQQRDSEKNAYCHTHNYPLIRIPYTHYLQLELKDLLVETTSFLVKPAEAPSNDLQTPSSRSGPHPPTKEELDDLFRKEETPIRPRCDKCVKVYPLCGFSDIRGNCPQYRRDPPDGGYYG